MVDGLHPGFCGLLDLVADVNLAGRIFAHDHHRQTRLGAMAVHQRICANFHALAQASSKGFAVDQFCGHGGVLLSQKSQLFSANLKRRTRGTTT